VPLGKIQYRGGFIDKYEPEGDKTVNGPVHQP